MTHRLGLSIAVPSLEIVIQALDITIPGLEIVILLLGIAIPFIEIMILFLGITIPRFEIMIPALGNAILKPSITILILWIRLFYTKVITPQGYSARCMAEAGKPPGGRVVTW